MPRDWRDALLFSDGSLTVFAPGTSEAQIKREREDADRNAPRSEWTKVVCLVISDMKIVIDPAASDPVPLSEVDALRAEIASLKARLGDVGIKG